MSDFWADLATPAEPPRTPAQAAADVIADLTGRPVRRPTPAATPVRWPKGLGEIPAADAWLIFRSVPVDGDGPPGRNWLAENLRVVRGRDLNAIERRGEPRDWNHDIPLLRDGDTDAAAAWRTFLHAWGLPPEQLADACAQIAQVEGMEGWLEQGKRYEAMRGGQ